MFYTPGFSAAACWLSPEESWHCVKVLRMKRGDKAQVTDGKGHWYETRILKADERQTLLEVMGSTFLYPPPVSFHLCIAPTKQMERMEWLVEKCVEIGISKLTFVQCQRSERKQLRLDRIEKVAIEAMKQSARAYLPSLEDLTPLKELLEKEKAQQGFIAHLVNENRFPLKSVMQPGRDVQVLIGPEGDFTPDEVGLALSKGYQAVSLGKARLRTETAGLLACMTTVLLNES
jgi:16S rRNA (uracil1498-N3)-methyltransferase